MTDLPVSQPSEQLNVGIVDQRTTSQSASGFLLGTANPWEVNGTPSQGKTKSAPHVFWKDVGLICPLCVA